MAGIDKTYVTRKEYYQVIEWAKDKKFDIINRKGIKVSDFICEHSEDIFDWIEETYPKNPTVVLWNTPTYFDVWLIRNCPLDFIQERLKEQYRSCYEEIKNYTSKYDTFKRNGLGRRAHFSIIKRPHFNIRSYYDFFGHRCKTKRSWWDVDITGPNGEYYWYDEKTDMFYSGNELASITCSCATVGGLNSKRKLARKIRKWNLPKGSQLLIKGYYVGQIYKIIVK